MNSNLHVMEAYTALLQVIDDESVRSRLAALIETILDHVVNLEKGTFGTFFDVEWRPLTTAVSFGHDIEGAWLLVAAAQAVGAPALVRRAERAAVVLADAVYRRGRDKRGAVCYELSPGSGDSPAYLDRTSHWWAQAEGMVGFLEAYRISDDQRFVEAARACWQFIVDHHVDSLGGDWFKVLGDDRRPVSAYPKAGAWECPYHHVRACLEVARRLQAQTLTRRDQAI